jgi:hypothetical protein
MTEDRAVCTIIAKNYVAFARTLMQSFQSYHPDYKCYVLIIDDFAGYIDPAQESFEIVKLNNLDIPHLAGFCFRYDVKELCTAAKAHLLEYLIREKSVRKLLYLDPDILVTAPLAGIYDQLETYDIVLTPHLDADFPDDDRLPNDGYILRAGQFNLGFIGVNDSDNARSFLKWWQQKLITNCVVDLVQGYFVDQKFIDFVPIFFENFLIEKDPGYNVAYWNLHNRRLSRENGAWRCNLGPLYFFHFSGYTPDGSSLSSHIPISMARHLLSSRRDLRELFAEYKDLLDGNGYEQTRTWPYTFATFKTGEPIPNHVRRFYRSLSESWGDGDPFDSEKLKGQATIETKIGNDTEQLNAILNSRAWRWVSRYGRFKNRYLTPAYQFFVRLLGSKQ